MSTPKGCRQYLRLAPLALLGMATFAAAQAPLSKLERANNGATSVRNGQHDFDFDMGTWKTQSSRLLRPLTGSTTWTELEGVTVVAPVWAGRANLAEYKGSGPGGSVELLSLRWYNPVSHQWYLDFATPKGGALGTPNVGEFRNGRGDFYDVESIGDRTILLRFSIWRIDDDHAQSEQAFSDNGGKTWEINWINKYTRIAATSSSQ